MGLRRTFFEVVEGVVVVGPAGVTVVACLPGVGEVGGEVVVGVLVVDVVEEEVVGDGVVEVVVIVVVFLVFGVEVEDEGVAVLIALLWWPWCLR